MQKFIVDLHVHTVLSACAEVEMIPPLIVQRAVALGVNAIAITDHNCVANVAAVLEAAQGSGLVVLPGMEVQSREEVHLLCLFDTLEQALAWDEQVARALPNLENDPDLFGAQYVVDATGEYLRTDERLLATSTSMSVEQIVAAVNNLGGLCLPAHVDRPSYSIFSNLGFIPPTLPIAGVEVSVNTTPADARVRFPQLSRYGIVVNGDAHRLNELVARTQIWVEQPAISELRLALAVREEEAQGRGVVVRNINSQNF